MAAAPIVRALLWTTFLAVLLPYCSAFRYNQSRHGDVSPSNEQDIFSAEAEAMIKHDETEEGEDHGKIDVPHGAKFTSFPVNPTGDEEIAGFISKDLDKKKLEHLFIVVHGRLRNGNDYWKLLDEVITEAKKDNFKGSDRETAVLAPQFFSTKFNSGQYKKNQLAWDDLNAWQPGGQATHPSYTTRTSFDVIDELLDFHSKKLEYPNLKNITVFGHGGGGQLVQRYSALGKDPASHLHVRYIHGDPSSSMYFTKDRPILEGTDISTQSCESYNLWRYGFDKFPGAGGMLKAPRDYFKQYVSRDVISIVGFQDTGRAGDTSCMANLQGGENRRARNLIWFRYINELARTQVDLDGFPGRFENLPDWSDTVDCKSALRLLVIEDAGHNAKKLFTTKVGRGALFHDSDLDEGWRPNRN